MDWQKVQELSEAADAIAAAKGSSPTEREVAEIRAQIRSGEIDPASVLDCLIWSQTPQELRENRTIWDNEIGFTQDDAPVFTPMYRRMIRARGLTQMDVNVCRAHLPKYARQYASYLAYGPVLYHTEP